MRNRFKKLCIRTGWLAGAGLFYLLICNLAGRPLIPCMFHQITGLYCPGCGVSRMCLALFRLDFVSAFRANAAIFLLLPAGLAIAIQTAVRYVKTGNGRLTRFQTWILAGMTVILLLFGILRNLPGFTWMQTMP